MKLNYLIWLRFLPALPSKANMFLLLLLLHFCLPLFPCVKSFGYVQNDFTLTVCTTRTDLVTQCCFHHFVTGIGSYRPLCPFLCLPDPFQIAYSPKALSHNSCTFPHILKVSGGFFCHKKRKVWTEIPQHEKQMFIWSIFILPFSKKNNNTRLLSCLYVFSKKDLMHKEKWWGAREKKQGWVPFRFLNDQLGWKQ